MSQTKQNLRNYGDMSRGGQRKRRPSSSSRRRHRGQRQPHTEPEGRESKERPLPLPRYALAAPGAGTQWWLLPLPASLGGRLHRGDWPPDQTVLSHVFRGSGQSCCQRCFATSCGFARVTKKSQRSSLLNMRQIVRF